MLEELVGLVPGAPIHTSIYAPDRMPDYYRRWDIRTSFMQRLPGVAAHHQKYLAFYPLAFQQMDLSGYDLVLSNKSGFCHGVRTKSEHGQATHVCYCLTPTRFLWQYDLYRQRERSAGPPAVCCTRCWRNCVSGTWRRRRRWIISSPSAAKCSNAFAASTGVRATVIFPPVDVDYFTPDAAQPVGDYYLVVSRLIPYKRVDLAVEAFRHLPNEKLLIVGDGRDMAALKAKAGKNVHFLGRQPREHVRELLRGCRAFLFPGLEDFGIAPVEAMSCGRPVIAFGGGGALDTVIAGVTGELFNEPTAHSLTATLADFNWRAYSPSACRGASRTF